MWLYDVQQFGLWFIGQTNSQPLGGHAQLIDGRHVVTQHHPVFMQHLQGDDCSLNSMFHTGKWEAIHNTAQYLLGRYLELTRYVDGYIPYM